MMKRITPDKRELVNMLLDGVEVFTSADPRTSYTLCKTTKGFGIRLTSGCKLENITNFNYRELFVEVPWYEDIPDCGVLCWLNGDVVLCIGFSVDGDNVRGHYKDRGSMYIGNIKNLTPLTKDDPRIIA